MEPFIGEIRVFMWDWAMEGFALCDGAILQVNQNPALFALINKTYGGDGVRTFALPDLRGRVAMPSDRTNDRYPLGEMGGAETVSLKADQVPRHSHRTNTVAFPGDAVGARDNLYAKVGQFRDNLPIDVYANPPMPPGSSLVMLSATTIASAGGGVAHPNMQPYLTVNFCIAIAGVFPIRG